MTRLWAASSSLLCVPILLGTRIGATVVACVGDSITERGFPSYPELLEGELSASLHAYVQVGNFGKGGKTALTTNKDSYVRETEYSEALQSNADVFVVQLGTNDAKLSLWDEGSFRADLRYLVAQFATLAQAPMVVLCAPPPYIEPEEDKWGPPEDNPINLVLADIIEEIANVSGYAFVDNFNLFLEVDNLQSYYADGIHPNQLGLSILATNVARTVASLLNGTEEYTISNATYAPTRVPTSFPTQPTSVPIPEPTLEPSTSRPSYVSTFLPTPIPTPIPTSCPTSFPRPTVQPSRIPTSEPSIRPTSPVPSAFASSTPWPSTSSPSRSFEPTTTTSTPSALPSIFPTGTLPTYLASMILDDVLASRVSDHETAAFVLTVEAVLDSVPVSTVNVTRVRPYASIGRRRLDNSTYVNASAIDFTLRSNAPLDEISSILDTAIASGDFTDILHALANGTALDQATAISVTVSNAFTPTMSPTDLQFASSSAPTTTDLEASSSSSNGGSSRMFSTFIIILVVLAIGVFLCFAGLLRWQRHVGAGKDPSDSFSSKAPPCKQTAMQTKPSPPLTSRKQAASLSMHSSALIDDWDQEPATLSGASLMPPLPPPSEVGSATPIGSVSSLLIPPPEFFSENGSDDPKVAETTATTALFDDTTFETSSSSSSSSSSDIESGFSVCSDPRRRRPSHQANAVITRADLSPRSIASSDAGSASSDPRPRSRRLHKAGAASKLSGSSPRSTQSSSSSHFTSKKRRRPPHATRRALVSADLNHNAIEDGERNSTITLSVDSQDQAGGVPEPPLLRDAGPSPLADFLCADAIANPG